MIETLRTFQFEITLLALLVPVLALAAVAMILRRRSLGAATRSAAYSTLVDFGLLSWLIATLVLTLWSTQGGVSEPPDLVPIKAIWTAAQEPTGSTFVVMILNIGLFLPLGILAPLKWPHWGGIWAVAWRGALISLAIEILQFLANPRRTASINDVLLNASGGVLGLLVALTFRRLFQPSAPRGRYRESKQRPW